MGPSKSPIKLTDNPTLAPTPGVSTREGQTCGLAQALNLTECNSTFCPEVYNKSETTCFCLSSGIETTTNSFRDCDCTRGFSLGPVGKDWGDPHYDTPDGNY